MSGYFNTPIVNEALLEIVSRARAAAMKHPDDSEMQAVLFVVDEYEKVLREMDRRLQVERTLPYG